MKWNRRIQRQKTNDEKLKTYALNKSKMSKIKGGEHWEYIDGEWVLVHD
ncbi:hypothetical protein FACS1894155_09190 [Bacteroidia bacterium]|nr:hypothetical protein FACS1894155_09190 [Bacteroidia bacterium]